MTCRSIWIPCAYYFIWTCPTANPVVLVIYPLHIVMSWYYVSHLPGLISARLREVKKIKDAGFKLTWTEALDAEKVAKAGIRSVETFHT